MCFASPPSFLFIFQELHLSRFQRSNAVWAQKFGSGDEWLPVIVLGNQLLHGNSGGAGKNRSGPWRPWSGSQRRCELKRLTSEGKSSHRRRYYCHSCFSEPCCGATDVTSTTKSTRKAVESVQYIHSVSGGTQRSRCQFCCYQIFLFLVSDFCILTGSESFATTIYLAHPVK